MPPRLLRRERLHRAQRQDRRRRQSRSLGDLRRRRPRLHRRGGVHQPVPAGPDRARGVPDDAVDHRHPQRRALAARGLREPLRAGRARGSLADRHRHGRLRGLPRRARGDRRIELVRRLRHPGRQAGGGRAGQGHRVGLSPAVPRAAGPAPRADDRRASRSCSSCGASTPRRSPGLPAGSRCATTE